MSLPLDFHPAVRGEMDDAYAWYEQRRPGLGRDFLDEVERVLADIVANPARYGFADADILTERCRGNVPRLSFSLSPLRGEGLGVRERLSPFQQTIGDFARMKRIL